MYTIHRVGQDGHWQQFDTTLVLISALQWLHRPCNAPRQFYRVTKEPSVKADHTIYSQVVDTSGQCTSVSLILAFKLNSVLVPFEAVFVNPVTYVDLSYPIIFSVYIVYCKLLVLQQLR